MLKNDNEPIVKAAAFLEEYFIDLRRAKNVPDKYNPEDKKEFLDQYDKLDIDEKHTCGELILSRAWAAVGSSKYKLAQE